MRYRLPTIPASFTDDQNQWANAWDKMGMELGKKINATMIGYDPEFRFYHNEHPPYSHGEAVSLEFAIKILKL